LAVLVQTCDLCRLFGTRNQRNNIIYYGVETPASYPPPQKKLQGSNFSIALRAQSRPIFKAASTPDNQHHDGNVVQQGSK